MRIEYMEILARLQENPKQAVLRWEAEFFQRLDDVATEICQNIDKSPVVLLTGPSASGKTTTGRRLCTMISERGGEDIDKIAHLISMDNYYKNRTDPDFPKGEDGEPDLESPLGLDAQLLNEHFSKLERGEDIMVPVFDFERQRRDPDRQILLDCEPGDIFVFEGIHALNPMFTEQHPNAFQIYLAPSDTFTMDGEVLCGQKEIRLMRRVVRDFQFRGASPTYSLALWDKVLEGEKDNIDPFRDGANVKLSTALPYELGILRQYIAPLVGNLRGDYTGSEWVQRLRPILENVEDLNPELVPPQSILREFIGTGNVIAAETRGRGE